MFLLHLTHYIGFFGAQIFNSILAVLIIKRAGKLFGPYRHLMLFFTLCSMLFSWVEIITQPVVHMKGPMFIVFLDQNRFPPGLGHYVACLHCGTFGFIISLLAAQYFYRYCVLCKPVLLEIFIGYRQFLILLTPCFIVYVVWFEVVDWGMKATLEKRLYIREDLKVNFDMDSMTVPFISSMYWNTDPFGEKLWRFKDLVSAVVCCCIISVVCTSILFFAFKIYFHMKTARIHMSQKTLELNRQLFIMLTVQTIFPFLLMYIPIGLLIGLPLFNLSLGPYANFTSGSIAIYPLIEPLIAMYCITDFRRAILRFFGWKGDVMVSTVDVMTVEVDARTFRTNLSMFQ